MQPTTRHQQSQFRNTPPSGGGSRPIEVTVLYTGDAGTARALEKAAELTKDLNARVRLLVPQVVPYPLSLENPPVREEFQEARLLELAQPYAMDTRVEVFLCRDANELVLNKLAPASVVIVGGRKRIWPTRESRAARTLRRHGHMVVFAETRSN
jgi:hypothetical protein